mgnify:CR=1 FL=1
MFQSSSRLFSQSTIYNSKHQSSQISWLLLQHWLSFAKRPNNVRIPRSAFPRHSRFRRSMRSARWPASGPTRMSGTAEMIKAVVSAVIDGASVNVNSMICASVRDASASPHCDSTWPPIARRKSGYLKRSRRRTCTALVFRRSRITLPLSRQFCVGVCRWSEQ